MMIYSRMLVVIKYESKCTTAFKVKTNAGRLKVFF